jgi:propionate catabolism operon transcriptional regulator
VVRLGSTQPLPVDLRIIAATHQPLSDLIDQGSFRSDLYYRLNILHLFLPPLRERPEDIALLALQLLYSALRRLGASLPADQALAPLLPLLRAYPWPGNVRELENISERLAVYLGDYHSVSAIDYGGMQSEFPELFRSARMAPLPARESPAASGAVPEDIDIVRTLEAAGGNRKLAAEQLGISRTTLWRRLRGLEHPQ